MQADKPGLAPAIIGGIIGAAIGVGLDVVLEGGLLERPYQLSWFPVVIGLLTGLGVRLANRRHLQRSYSRGAVSALIALAAIVAASFAVREVMARRDTSKTLNAAAAPAVDEADEAGGEEGADVDAAVEAAEDEPAVAPAAGAGIAINAGQPRVASDLNPWQFVFMALGALVAYELGRGPDPARRTIDEHPADEPVVGGADPSN